MNEILVGSHVVLRDGIEHEHLFKLAGTIHTVDEVKHVNLPYETLFIRIKGYKGMFYSSIFELW